MGLGGNRHLTSLAIGAASVIGPTLCVGVPHRTLRVHFCDAERHWLHSHAERGNDQFTTLGRQEKTMTVDPLKHPRAELKAAENALQAMRAAQSFDKFEEEWRSFLNHLEKVWVKAERACQHIQNQFQPWQGEYSRLRKKDMLLRYLKQARDADNHSIQEVVEHKPGRYSFSVPGGPGVVRIDRLSTGGDGRVIEYVGSHRPTIIDEPPQINVVPVKNNGQWFNPPTSHLDESVSVRHPVQIAELGLRFYAGWLSEVETKFFGGKKA